MAELHWDKTAALAETAGDEALLEELLSLFREAAAEDLDRMRQAVTVGDSATAMAAAHSLKGAAASLGLESIRRLAEAVEQAGPSGDIASARQTLPILADLLDQLAALLLESPHWKKRKAVPGPDRPDTASRVNGGPAQGPATVTAE